MAASPAPTASGRAGAEGARARLDRHELAGGLGDAGLLIPLAVAMVALNGLSATATFALVGIAYIATAFFFRLPVPVQPLKAFAAAAVALGLSASVIAAGALLMSAAMAILAISGLAAWLAARFPLILIRGIQASVSLLLIKAAVELANRGNWEGLPAIAPAAGLAGAAVVCALLFAAKRTWLLPGSLLVLVLGFAVGLAVDGWPSGLELGPGQVGIALPDGDAFATALGALVIAQLPLTFGNSIVATADAERAYFGERAARVRPERLAASIGTWNLLAGLTAAMPVCHGAGGVTAHYRLGARTGVATASAGVLFLTLALLLGDSLPVLLQLLVPGALAGMLLFVALQHGALAMNLERRSDRLLAAGVGIVTLISGNLAIGFAAGAAALGARALWRRRASATPHPLTRQRPA